jgi:putative membrane protein
MNYDFSKPQRQSAVGIIIMAANSLQHTVRALALPLVIAIVKLDKTFLAYAGIGLIVLFAGVLIYSYFNYRKFTFYLDDKKQEFVINKGIFNKTQLTVQLDKIQQVNINQNLLQKIIGIYGLKIDTAGTDDQEVHIKAISEPLANSLREHLLSRKSTAILSSEAINESNDQDIPFLKVNATTLFKVALTSNYGSSIALLIAFVFPLYHNAKELFMALNMDEKQVDNAFKAAFTFFSLSILIGGTLLLLLIINIVRTFVKYFELTISKHKHSLLISSGLLARKNTLLNPNKVQITTYSQNYFQKKMNLLNMSLKQANSGDSHKKQDLQSTNLSIPGCNPIERDQLMRMILDNVPPKSASFYPNWRYVNLPILFMMVLPLTIFFLFWINIPDLKPFYPVGICYAVFILVMIYFSYKRHRISVDENFIIKRRGIWDISHEIILPHKIQAITTFQYPWHKSVDVGHVNLHTAAGILHFKYGNFTEIKKLVNYWLYQIESGSEEWM